MSETDLFDSHPDPVLGYHRGQRVTVAAVNPAFARQFAVEAADLVGEPVEAALAAVGVDADLDTLDAGIDGVSTGLTAETGVAAVAGRQYALRQIETDDGGYLLLTDVSASIERRQELEAENDRLEGFARTLSHDLRNPLEVAQSRLMAARETGDEIHFEKTQAAHSRIKELVEDVLTLAKSGSAISETEPVDIGAVATDAWETVDAEAATLAVGDELGTVVADPERLRTLFENLFRNSVEHSSTGSRTQSGDSIEHAGADVSISVEATEAGFVVADDGPGIPPDRREAVFEAGVSTGNGTTGLGLAIVSEIAAAHGWTVSLTESPAGGAQFEFSRSSA